MMKFLKKTYVRKYLPVRPLIAVVIMLLPGLFVPNFVSDISAGFESKLKIYIPPLVIYGVFVVYTTYVILKLILGVFHLIAVLNFAPKLHLFYDEFQNSNPKYLIDNPLEEYSLLAVALYEINHIIELDEDSIKYIEKNKNFATRFVFNQGGNHRGLAQYLNSLEATSDLDRENYGKYLKSSLAYSFDIVDRETALQQIDCLLDNVQIINNLMEIDEYKACREVVHDLGFVMPKLIYEEFINDCAFDLVILVWVARSSFTLGYLTEDELRDILIRMGLFLSEYYETWAEFAYSYLCGLCASNYQNEEMWSSQFYWEMKLQIYGVNALLNEAGSPWYNRSLSELREFIDDIDEDSEHV